MAGEVQFQKLYEFLANHTFGGESWQEAADSNDDTVVVQAEFYEFINKWCPEDINHDKDIIAQFWSKIDTNVSQDKFNCHGNSYVNSGALNKTEQDTLNEYLESIRGNASDISIIDGKPYTNTMAILNERFISVFFGESNYDLAKELGDKIDEYLASHPDATIDDVIAALHYTLNGVTSDPKQGVYNSILEGIGQKPDAKGFSTVRMAYLLHVVKEQAIEYCKNKE